MIEFSTGEFLAGIALVLFTGVLSGFGGAVVAIKVLGKEIEWIKDSLARHDRSISQLHDRISSHVSHFHGPNHDSESKAG